ncbi:hypothetical protein LguiA_005897 [Lonicera macranthoides]
MNSQFLLLLNFFFLLQSSSSSIAPNFYHNCSNTTFTCGSLTGISYPFRGHMYPEYCGYPGLQLNCQPNNITTIHIASTTYRILSIDQTSQIMKIAREDLMESTCPRDLLNTTLDYNLFQYASNYINITFLYGCPVFPGFNMLPCGSFVLPGVKGPAGICNVSVVVPVLPTALGHLPNFEGLGRVLRQGLEVRWTLDMNGCRECTRSGGFCGYDFGAKRTTCFCPTPPNQFTTCSEPMTTQAPPGPLPIPASIFHTCLCADNEQYVACGQLFQCANINDIGYPFWGENRPEYCGHPGFSLYNCQADTPLLTINNQSYRVLRIENITRTVTIARADLWDTTCPDVLYNTTLDLNLFSPVSTNQNLNLLYGCTLFPGQTQPLLNQFECILGQTTSFGFYGIGVSLVNCNQSVIVPVSQRWAEALARPTASLIDLRQALASGFGLQWVANDTVCNRCEVSGGRCGSNSSSGMFACYCADRPYSFEVSGCESPEPVQRAD